MAKQTDCPFKDGERIAATQSVEAINHKAVVVKHDTEFMVKSMHFRRRNGRKEWVANVSGGLEFPADKFRQVNPDISPPQGRKPNKFVRRNVSAH